MKRLPLFILLSIFFFTSSCDKNDESFYYPGIYYKSKYGYTGKYRLFDNTGEILSNSTINRFYNTDILLFEYYAKSIMAVGTILDSLRFPDEQSASVMENYQWKSCSPERMGNKIVLIKKDTTLGYTDLDVLTRSVRYYVGEVKPAVFDENLYFVAGGYYYFSYRALENYVLIQKREQWIAPIIQFCVHRSGLGSYGYLNNVVAKDFYKSIPAGDTISIREGNLEFKK